MHDSLFGGRVQRASVWHVGGREVAVLGVRVPPRGPDGATGESVHVVLAGGTGVGVVDASGRGRLRDALGRVVSPAQPLWRARLEGGRVVGVEDRTIAVVRDGRRFDARTDGPAGALRLVEEAIGGEDDAGSGGAGASYEESDLAAVVAAREALGVRIVETLSGAGVDGRRGELRRAVAKAAGKLKRRIEAIKGDLARVAEAEARAEVARLFVGAAAKAGPGTARLEGVDWSSGEARAVTLDVDPARAARPQLDAIFSRARRLREGAAIASTRLEEASRASAALAGIAQVLASDEAVDLAEVEARARSAAPRELKLPGPPPGPGGKARDAVARPPYRLFHGASGARILVGRGAAHNDELTFHVARPHDLWLHAKGYAGAHVVVSLDKGSSCPADVLVEAAHLAAHFSDAREEVLVEVQYAPRRYLRKPRGSAPGLVVVDREKVMLLRRDPGVLARLLRQEQL